MKMKRLKLSEKIRGGLLLLIILTFLHVIFLYQRTELANNLQPNPWYTTWSEIPLKNRFTSPLLWNTKTNLCFQNTSDPNDLTLAIVVSSARSNFERRNLIRETWGSIKKLRNWSISISFVIGDAPSEESLVVKKELENESQIHGDLIMGQFIDSYENLTLKTLMGYEWLREYCANVKLAMKCDDDVILNVFLLTKILNENPAKFFQSNFHCYVRKGEIPMRSGKWSVAKKDYPGELYPNFCSGLGYLMSPLVVDKVLMEMRHAQANYKISNEDVLFTGIIPDNYNKKSRKREEVIRHYGVRVPWNYPSIKVRVSYDPLREWYTSEGDWVPEFEYPIFYVLEHGQYFEKDFKGVWNKVQKIFAN